MTVMHYDWLAHHAERVPGKEVWVDLHSNRQFTYAEANARCNKTANALLALGLGVVVVMVV